MLPHLTVGRGAREALPDASARALIGAVAEAMDQTGPVDLAWLRGTLDDLARQVRAAFVRYIGEIQP